MTITFKNSFKDRLAFAAYHLPRSPILLIMILGGSIFIGYRMLTLGPGESAEQYPLRVRVVAFIMMELVILCLTGAVVVVSLISRRNKTLDCQRTMTLAEEGFYGESEYGKSEVRWTMVQKLARTRNHIFIYLNQSGAVVVPRRAFADAAQWEAFYDFCRQRIHK